MSDSIKIRRNIKDEDAVYFIALLMSKYCPNGVAAFTDEEMESLPDIVTIMAVNTDDEFVIHYVKGE